jgi:hypothetical protein
MRINVSLKESTVDLIDKLAEEYWLNRSSFISLAVHSFKKQPILTVLEEPTTELQATVSEEPQDEEIKSYEMYELKWKETPKDSLYIRSIEKRRWIEVKKTWKSKAKRDNEMTYAGSSGLFSSFREASRHTQWYLARLDPDNPSKEMITLIKWDVAAPDYYWKECVMWLFSTWYGDTIWEALASFWQSYDVHYKQTRDNPGMTAEHVVIMFHPNNRENLCNYIEKQQLKAIEDDKN